MSNQLLEEPTPEQREIIDAIWQRMIEIKAMADALERSGYGPLIMTTQSGSGVTVGIKAHTTGKPWDG